MCGYPAGYAPAMPMFLDILRTWSARRWIAAALMSAFGFLAIGLITVIIPNPVFGRGVPVTSWAMAVLAATSVLGGLVFATYVRNDAFELEAADRTSRAGFGGAMLSLFAVGCPTCNKLVLIAVGSSGAVRWFAPVQPYLAAGSLALLAWSLRTRVLRESSCVLPRR